MICSNEPGYYEDGGFGIRVENLLTIEEAGTEFRWECGNRMAAVLCPTSEKGGFFQWM
jgi:Xaa-Pro aminopeptidase